MKGIVSTEGSGRFLPPVPTALPLTGEGIVFIGPLWIETWAVKAALLIVALTAVDVLLFVLARRWRT